MPANPRTQSSKEAPDKPVSPSGFNELFRRAARAAAKAFGSAWAFAFAVLTILIWAVLGPVFHFSDTWQLVINTGTTIITFLMVFLIQNTQNRDAQSLHLKIDELIRAQKGARNRLVDLDDLSDEDLEQLQQQFKRIAAHTEGALAKEARKVEDLAGRVRSERGSVKGNIEG
jgi:low affinity Fe/Cu permease